MKKILSTCSLAIALSLGGGLLPAAANAQSDASLAVSALPVASVVLSAAAAGTAASAVVAVPAQSAQSVVNTAVQAGIRAILNFSPGTLKVPPGVKLKNVDLTVSLESLSFFLARGEADAAPA